MEGPYDVWLTETLVAASSDIDTDVFVGYIISMLEDEDTAEEDTIEDIKGLLCGVVEEDVASKLCSTILSQWAKTSQNVSAAPETVDKSDQLSKMFGQQTLATVQVKTMTKEEKERKAAILAQFAQVSGDEEEEDDEDDCDSEGMLMRNSNKQEVADAEKALREKSREEAEAKKEKDKQDRIAQKQKANERKETEKKRTQKGERRTR